MSDLTFKCAAPVLLAVVAICSCGCERTYGISRTADLSRFPEPACIREVLDSLPAIRNYDERIWTEETESTQARRTLRFAYSGERVTVRLTLLDEGAGDIEFDHSFLFVRPIPKEEVDEARGLMLKVEAGLIARCNLTELEADVQEWCPGVDCP